MWEITLKSVANYEYVNVSSWQCAAFNIAENYPWLTTANPQRAAIEFAKFSAPAMTARGQKETLRNATIYSQWVPIRLQDLQTPNTSPLTEEPFRGARLPGHLF
jgi:hypothetical protein